MLIPVETHRCVEEGRNIVISCTGVGHPSPLVQWKKVNGSFSDRVSTTDILNSTNLRNVTRVTVDLIVTTAHREDTAVYECTVSSLQKNVTRNVSLTVQCM